MVFWLYHSASKPGNANPAGPSKDGVCAQTRSDSDLGGYGDKGWGLHNKHLFCCWENQSQFFLGNLHIFNICIIPTLKTNPNISHLQCHGGFCSEAIFEEGFYMCVFLKYGRQARLGPSQHNITQYS